MIPEDFKAPKPLRKLNGDLLRLQAVLRQNYAGLEETFTRMTNGTYVVINGRYVYRRGWGREKAIISAWTKPMEESDAKCLYNAPVFLYQERSTTAVATSRTQNSSQNIL